MAYFDVLAARPVADADTDGAEREGRRDAPARCLHWEEPTIAHVATQDIAGELGNRVRLAKVRDMASIRSGIATAICHGIPWR